MRSVPLGAAALAALPLALAGCGDTGTAREGAGGGTLTVFAAASLTEAFTALGKAFESDHPGVKVRFNFGGSSALARQITEGAPADVFAAADTATMGRVVGGAVKAGGTRVFARNRLVIAVPRDGGTGVRGLRDLARPGLKVVVCAEQVPCGAAAGKALGAAGVRLRPASQEQDVKAVLTKVRLGEADAGLVYRTDARSAAGEVRGVEFPESARAVNDYPIAALDRAPRPELAADFVRLVRSEQGRGALAQAGFETP
ncbi:molybdate ABC transporter substrate-binding protein [Actinomadura sp. 21ATH]|uniref:molybdate ABC transporter substrate-binding protein n=1 Tax=Actinomadura sp. 21ATH TaxID=1735444 RepID=UPI0035C20550